MEESQEKAIETVARLKEEAENSQHFEALLVDQLVCLYEPLKELTEILNIFSRWENQNFSHDRADGLIGDRLQTYFDRVNQKMFSAENIREESERACLEEVSKQLEYFLGRMGINPSTYDSLSRFLEDFRAILNSRLEADGNALRYERENSLTRLKTIQFFIQSGILDRQWGESKFRTTEGRIVDASFVVEKLKSLLPDKGQADAVAKQLHEMFPLYGVKQFTHHEKNTRLRGLLIYLEEEIDLLEHGDWRTPGLRTRQEYDPF